METERPKVAVLGNGYWGKNLVRNFHQLGALEYVCDTKQEVIAQAHAQYGAKTTQDYGVVLEDPAIKGVVIAAPAARHYELARRALLAGKDVFVEKPLALKTEEGCELVKLAAEHSRILMVGHILQYHPAILKLKDLICSGELGKIHYIYSSRLNMGKLRTEEDIVWSFAPHDISAILFLLDENPIRVMAHGGCYINTRIFDTTLTTCDFESGAKAHIFVSWLHPFKEQKLTIVGERKMAVFDDVEPERKLVLYAHRIDWLDRVPVAHKEEGHVIALPSLEPLRQECEHFLECVERRQKPRTDGESALQVLRVLERFEQSLLRSGQPMELVPATPKYFAHSTAVIDDGSEIGEGTKIWHFSHIMSGSKLGKNCNVGQNVVVSPDVKIGNNVKIQNNVSVYTGVELQDNVFCGPSMVFTNVINPRSHVVRRNEYRKTLVKEGATIGANATIVCGVTIGRYAFVAAGAVVTHDVADYALVKGTPARRTGFMCYCGIQLPKAKTSQCAVCGKRYQLRDGSLFEISTTPDTETKKVAATAGMSA